MKTLYLVRHGKAVSRDLDIPDYERTLADRGINDSFLVARKLRKAKVKPSLFISSPAPRALQTAKMFAKHLDYDEGKILTRKALYDQEGNALLRIIRTIKDEYETIILFGHDPSFSFFAQFIIDDFDSDIPTCGVIGVDCSIDSWKEINRNTGTLGMFEYPKELNKKINYGSLRKDIEAILKASVMEQLSEVNTETAKKLKKNIAKSTRDLSEIFVKQMKKITRKK